MTAPARRARGMTLLELMVVLAVVAVLASLAFGYGGNFMRVQAQRALARNAILALAEGRSQAMNRGTRVMVQVVANKLTAFLDGNGNYAYDAADRLLYAYPNSGSESLSASLSLTAPALGAGNPANAPVVIFDFQGFSVTATGQPQMGTLCVRDSTLARPLAVVVSVAGALRQVNDNSVLALCP